jgi:hypothetical protein
MATIDVSLRPFSVPNFVIINMPPKSRQSGIHELPTIALAEVDAGILGMLCDNFRRDVFSKAGKADPSKE